MVCSTQNSHQALRQAALDWGRGVFAIRYRPRYDPVQEVMGAARAQKEAVPFLISPAVSQEDMNSKKPLRSNTPKYTHTPSERPATLPLTPKGSLHPLPNPGVVSPSSQGEARAQQQHRRETLTLTPDASVRSCGRMGETDTHGETRKGGALCLPHTLATCP